jgi:hypothetical protein
LNRTGVVPITAPSSFTVAPAGVELMSYHFDGGGGTYGGGFEAQASIQKTRKPALMEKNRFGRFTIFPL